MGKKKGLLVVVSGFSGSGKDSLVKLLMENHDEYVLSISMTTRKKRDNEEEGKDYFFSSIDKFEKLISEDAFLEYAKYADNYYGTPKKFVEEKLAKGKNVILIIEVQGAVQIKKKFPEALLLFITTPDAHELKMRLEKRGTESEGEVKKRLKRAVDEAKYMSSYEYIIVNDDLEASSSKLHEIVCASENASLRRSDFIRKMQIDLEKEYS